MYNKSLNNSQKYFILAIFYIMLFQDAIEGYTGSFGMLDEVLGIGISFLALIKILKDRNKKDIYFLKKEKENKELKNNNKKILIALILLTLIGILGNIVYKYQNIIPLMKDMSVVIKGILIYISIPILFEGFRIDEYLSFMNKHLKILSIIIFLIVCANFILDIFPCYEMRFGIESQQIFFTHPTYLASFSVMVIVLLSVSLEHNKENWKYIGIMLLVLASTLRFKSIAFIPVYLYVVYIVIIKKRKINLKDITILCLLGSLFAASQIMEYLQNTDWARSALSINSVIIAKDHFPLGSGFGTYASWVSGESYSNVYNIYNMNLIWGLSPDFYSFVADTFWPMIIGQFGYIGLILYVYILLKIYANIKNTKNLYKYFGQICLLLYLLVLSAAEASFSGPIAVLYLGVISILGEQKQ